MSPHLDDAVWSLGALLCQLAMSYDVRVITVFSHSAFVYDELAPPAYATLLRKAENAIALKKTGVHDHSCLNFPEAVLRDKSLETIFDSDYQLPEYVQDLLINTLRQSIPDSAVVLAPSAFGDHVDHIAVRDSIGSLFKQVIYYEDMPYVTRPDRATAAQVFLHMKGVKELRLPLNKALIDLHIDRYNDYTSQRKQHHITEIRQYLLQKGYGLWV